MFEEVRCRLLFGFVSVDAVEANALFLPHVSAVPAFELGFLTDYFTGCGFGPRGVGQNLPGVFLGPVPERLVSPGGAPQPLAGQQKAERPIIDSSARNNG